MPIPAFIRVETDDNGKPELGGFTNEVPADATAIICAPFSIPLLLPDNHVGNCAGCGAALQFRPVPVSVPRVCYRCAPEWIEGAANPQ